MPTYLEPSVQVKVPSPSRRPLRQWPTYLQPWLGLPSLPRLLAVRVHACCDVVHSTRPSRHQHQTANVPIAHQECPMSVLLPTAPRSLVHIAIRPNLSALPLLDAHLEFTLVLVAISCNQNAPAIADVLFPLALIDVAICPRKAALPVPHGVLEIADVPALLTNKSAKSPRPHSRAVDPRCSLAKMVMAATLL